MTATYAKKPCSRCGIKLPQPELARRIISDIGVNGNVLAPRAKWFCSACDPHKPVRLHMTIREKVAAENAEIIKRKDEKRR